LVVVVVLVEAGGVVVSGCFPQPIKSAATAAIIKTFFIYISLLFPSEPKLPGGSVESKRKFA
jgi:hypothetical protein